MKKITLQLLSMQPTTEGGFALITKVTKENPSENGVHKMNAVQIERLAARTIGFGGHMGVIALKQAIAVSNGSASLTIDAELCKVGEAWENKKTGETGIYGWENGVLKADAKDWTKYSNHEVKLGLAAEMTLLNTILTAGVQNVAQYAPAQQAQPVANKALGIDAETKEVIEP